MRLCARSRLDSKHVAADNLDVALLVFHDTRDGQRPRIANAQFLWNVAQARFSAVPACMTSSQGPRMPAARTPRFSRTGLSPVLSAGGDFKRELLTGRPAADSQASHVHAQ